MTEACSWTRELWVAGRLWPSLQEELTVLPILGTAGTLVLKPQGQGFCQWSVGAWAALSPVQSSDEDAIAHPWFQPSEALSRGPGHAVPTLSPDEMIHEFCSALNLC